MELEDWTIAITTFPVTTGIVILVVVGYVALFWRPVKNGVLKGVDRVWRRRDYSSFRP